MAGRLIDEAFADGCTTITVDPSDPDPEAPSFTHPDFDPVWARFVGRDVAFVVHIAVDGHYDPVPPSFHNNGRTRLAAGGDAPDSILGLVATPVLGTVEAAVSNRTGAHPLRSVCQRAGGLVDRPSRRASAAVG